jgi:hypothetical protein
LHQFKIIKKFWISDVVPRLSFHCNIYTREQQQPHDRDCPECGKTREPVENDIKGTFDCMVRTQILHCINNHYWFPWHPQVFTKEEAVKHGLMWDDHGKAQDIVCPNNLSKWLSAPIPAYYYGPDVIREILYATLKREMSVLKKQLTPLNELEGLIYEFDWNVTQGLDV